MLASSSFTCFQDAKSAHVRQIHVEDRDVGHRGFEVLERLRTVRRLDDFEAGPTQPSAKDVACRLVVVDEEHERTLELIGNDAHRSSVRSSPLSTASSLDRVSSDFASNACARRHGGAGRNPEIHRRDDHYRHVAQCRLRAHPREDILAVRIWHAQVQEHTAGYVACHRVGGRRCVGCFDDTVRQPLEHSSERRPEGLVVVNDQHRVQRDFAVDRLRRSRHWPFHRTGTVNVNVLPPSRLAHHGELRRTAPRRDGGCVRGPDPSRAIGS
jgi:hypothetical protein